MSAEEGTDHFAVSGVANCDDAGFGDGWVGGEEEFDSEGEDILASCLSRIGCQTCCMQGYDAKGRGRGAGKGAFSPRMIMSLILPVTEQYPSSSIMHSSPVYIHSTPFSSLFI